MIWKEKGLWEKNAAQRRFDLLLTWLAILTSFPVLGVDAGHVKWSTHAVPTPEVSLSLPPTQRCAGKPEVNAFLLALGRRLSVGDSLGPVTHRCILRGASAPHEMHDQANDGHDE